jgi:hypothetical protein
LLAPQREGDAAKQYDDQGSIHGYVLLSEAQTRDPLTRPAPADESAVAVHPLPQVGEGHYSKRGLR